MTEELAPMTLTKEQEEAIANADTLEEAIRINIEPQIEDTIKVLKERCKTDLILFNTIMLVDNVWTVRYIMESLDGKPFLAEMVLGENAGFITSNPVTALMIAMTGIIPERKDAALFDIEAEISLQITVEIFKRHFKQVVVAKTQIEHFQQVYDYMPTEEHKKNLEMATAELERRRAARQFKEQPVEGSA